MVVDFAGKKIYLPHGYKLVGENRFQSGVGTEHQLVMLADGSVCLEALNEKRKRSAPLEVVGDDKSQNAIQFISKTFKAKARVAIIEESGIMLFRGFVSDMPREIIENKVVTGLRGFDSVGNIIVAVSSF